MRSKCDQETIVVEPLNWNRGDVVFIERVEVHLQNIRWMDRDGINMWMNSRW